MRTLALDYFEWGIPTTAEVLIKLGRNPYVFPGKIRRQFVHQLPRAV